MSGTHTVLCVDDDKQFLDLTETYLRKADFEVEKATGGAEALDVLESRPWIEAVVSDYQMPEMDGLDLLREVRSDHPDLPFLLFTGEGSETIASEAINAGVTDYLQKSGPEQYDLLVNRLSNAIERAEMQSGYEREKQIRERILEASPIGIVGHDDDGSVIFRNERALEILNACDADLDAHEYGEDNWTLRNPDGPLISPEELPYRRVIDNPGETLEARYVLKLADGVEKPIRVFGAPLLGSDETVTGAVIAFYESERDLV